MASDEQNLTLFVGNLAFDIIPADIDDLFKDMKVKALRLVRDRETDRFKGYAYVEFEDEDSRDRALELNGVELMGRAVRISPANSRRGGNNQRSSGFGRRDGAFSRRNEGYGNNNYGGGYGRGDSYGGGNQRQERPRNEIPDSAPFTAFVGNFSYDATEDDLAKFFDGLGIDEVRIVRDRETNASKGHGYVDFKTRGDLENALTANDVLFMERNIRIDVANQRSSGGFNQRGGRNLWGQSNNYGAAGGASDGLWRKSAGGEYNPNQPRTSSTAVTADADTKEDPFGGAKPRPGADATATSENKNESNNAEKAAVSN